MAIEGQFVFAAAPGGEQLFGQGYRPSSAAAGAVAAVIRRSSDRTVDWWSQKSPSQQFNPPFVNEIKIIT